MHTIKNLSQAEDYFHDHFDTSDGLPADAVMPASLIIEGMAQTAGLLVGSVNKFKEKVILAKIQRVELDEDAVPGQCLKFEANLTRVDTAGAATEGLVLRLDHHDREWREIGRISLMFSHIDKNMSGREFPEHNFVFGENFKNLIRISNVDISVD
jgi:3-hydroxyacyl-[acyl-carrier-protein] dehydratase